MTFDFAGNFTVRLQDFTFDVYPPDNFYISLDRCFDNEAKLSELPRVIEMLQTYRQHIRAHLKLLELSSIVDELKEYPTKARLAVHLLNWEARDKARRLIETSIEDIALCIDFALAKPFLPIKDGFRREDAISEFSATIDSIRLAFEMVANMQKAGEYRERRDGYVYLMHLYPTNHYKIGYSIDPERRAREVVSGLPLEIEVIHCIATNQTACLENELHKKFSAKRHSRRNEWFALTLEDIEYITSMERVEYDWIDSGNWDEFWEERYRLLRESASAS